MSWFKWLSSLTLLLGATGEVCAGTSHLVTDTSWRAIGPVGNLERSPINSVGLTWEAQHPGWNTGLSFDDSDAAGWHNAILSRTWYAYPNAIWVDDNSNNSGSTPAYFRKVFTIDGAPTGGLLTVGVDDDVQIWINGQLAVADHNGGATTLVNVPVGAYLKPGENLIAIKAHDSYGFCEWMGMALEIQYNANPIADAGQDQTVEAQGERTEVHLDGSASHDPDGDTLAYEWSVPDGVFLDDRTSPTPTGLFPVGRTQVTLTVTDGNGGMSVDTVAITLQDTTRPAAELSADKAALWPPDHRVVEVTLRLKASDNAVGPDDLIVACRISSSEPDDALGDGAFTGDVDGKDAFTAPVAVDLVWDPVELCYLATVHLRAERDGSESGRTYSIVCDVVDAMGNVGTDSCAVVVPHDRRR